MSEWKKLKTVAKYELLKHVRMWRFYGVLGITLFAIILMTALYHSLDLPAKMHIPAIITERYGAELFGMFATSMSSLVVIGAVFFSGGAIASEFEQKTGYILLPNPVKRTTIIIGKYIACVVATSLIMLAAYCTSALALLLLYGHVPLGLFGSLAIALMLGCMVISLAFVFSAVIKGGMGATIGTLLTFMVVFSIISSTLSHAGFEPWFMPDRAGDAISSTYGLQLEELFGGAFGGTRWATGLLRASQDPYVSFGVLSFYNFLFLVIAIKLAIRREMT